MTAKLIPIVSTLLLTFGLGIAHAADTNGGAVIGTPGQENKGNPIAVPDKEKQESDQPAKNPAASTPAEESKGKPTIPQ